MDISTFMLFIIGHMKYKQREQGWQNASNGEGYWTPSPRQIQDKKATFCQFCAQKVGERGGGGQRAVEPPVPHPSSANSERQDYSASKYNYVSLTAVWALRLIVNWSGYALKRAHKTKQGLRHGQNVFVYIPKKKRNQVNFIVSFWNNFMTGEYQYNLMIVFFTKIMPVTLNCLNHYIFACMPQ